MVAGAAAGGCITQIIALGAADKYLTQNPTITYWRFKYNKYTNFALEAIEQAFQTQVMFGSDTQLTMNRTGDMIYWTYVLVDLPAIQASFQTGPASNAVFPAFTKAALCDPCGDNASGTNLGIPIPGCTYPFQASDSTTMGVDSNGNPDPTTNSWCCWTNAIGQWLVRRASIVIGGQVIDTVYADYLYMWEELSGKPGKRLQELIGKDSNFESLIQDSQRDRRLYIPLPFWFTQSSGNALPVVSLQFHGIQLHVSFAELATCIQTSTPPDGSYMQVSRWNSPTTSISEQDLRALIETTYVYLDIEERDRLSMGSFEQLITQVQYYNLATRQQQVRLNLNFNHPVIELVWAVRRSCQQVLNNNFNYSGVNGEDPVRAVSLKLNNLPRFSPKEGRYFRLVQPWQSHTNIPESYVYSYSFALHPEEAQPSGSCNFSRIDNIELTLDMQVGISTATGSSTGDFYVMVYARNWNVLRYRDGLAGLAFSN